MDITLIPQAESKYNKKLHKSFITDSAIVELTDCCLVLLHKSGLRPLFSLGKEERILFTPEHKTMAKPDLIIYNESEVGKQSARVIQEQLGNSGHPVRILGTDFSAIRNSNNPEILKNILSTRSSYLEQKGYHHIVVVAENGILDKIALCMNGKGLNQSYNIPIYSFSDGQEIEDVNLSQNFYITRDLLDDWLVGAVNRGMNKKLAHYKGKCYHPLPLHYLQKKLHFPE